MNAEGQIKSFIDRVLRLKEEQDELGRDIREVYSEAKSMGFDKTALGNVVAHLRKVEKKGRDAINEGNAIFDMYLSAYEGSHTHAPARARENIEQFPTAKGAENGGTYPLHVERTNNEQRHEARVPGADGRGEGADESAQGQGSGTPGPDRHGGPVTGTLAGEDEDGRGGHVGREARHEIVDPETGEILESVQSHDALGPSEPAESSSGAISAPDAPRPSINDEPSPEAGPQAEASYTREVGEAGMPADREGRHEGEAASVGLPTNPNPRPTSSPAVDMAGEPQDGNEAVSGSPAFINPKCLNPQTCLSVHSKTACFDCVMEYAKRPTDEQKRLWAEAIGLVAA